MKELDLGWQEIGGKVAILIVAGHNFNQIRDGEEKWADLGTGEIARILCEKYECFGIISTKVQSDPNWDIHSPFRQQVRQIVANESIKLIIDVHGSKLNRKNMIEIYPNQKFRCDYDLISLGLPIKTFKEDEQYTIYERCENEVAALQIEIREDGRVKTIDEAIYRQTEEKLDNLMQSLIK